MEVEFEVQCHDIVQYKLIAMVNIMSVACKPTEEKPMGVGDFSLSIEVKVVDPSSLHNESSDNTAKKHHRNSHERTNMHEGHSR